jgi:hypothetical protein
MEWAACASSCTQLRPKTIHHQGSPICALQEESHLPNLYILEYYRAKRSVWYGFIDQVMHGAAHTHHRQVKGLFRGGLNGETLFNQFDRPTVPDLVLEAFR